jgi:hypothetical protein
VCAGGERRRGIEVPGTFPLSIMFHNPQQSDVSLNSMTLSPWLSIVLLESPSAERIHFHFTSSIHGTGWKEEGRVREYI